MTSLMERSEGSEILRHGVPQYDQFHTAVILNVMKDLRDSSFPAVTQNDRRWGCLE
jgi:hypothetical protein